MGIQSLIDYIYTHIQAMSLLVASISAMIAVFSTIAAFRANHQSRKQYLDSIQPQLSMSLIELNSYLYLRVKNVGKLAAKSIEIRIIGIKNNGALNALKIDGLFTDSFELYPDEVVQGHVALCGRTMDQEIFPQVEVSVSYRPGNAKKAITYHRTVTCLSTSAEKNTVDTRTIEGWLKCIARASVRTANYLDGHQITTLDEFDILANCSLKSDLCEVFQDEPETSRSYSETIAKTSGDDKEDTHANT